MRRIRLAALMTPVLALASACSSNHAPDVIEAGSMRDATLAMDTIDSTTVIDAADAFDATLATDIVDAVDTASADADAGTAPIDWCSRPGAIRFTVSGTTTVPGGGPTPDLSFLHLPAGFCAHHFGVVGNARQLRLAPSGEIFVASPTALTTGGGQGGQAAIVVLADDDHDGVADAPVTYLASLNSTQGLMFVPDWFYYQDGTAIRRVPYAPGDRAPRGASEMVANITYYTSNLHWPKTLDVADDGSIYVGNGGDQGETCATPHAFHGGIRRLDGAANGAPVAQGLRNPIAVRCAHGHNLCFALEHGKDYTASSGGREKLVPIRAGDDWGFPCCATRNVPYGDVSPSTDCSGVAAETVSFYVGDTPFGLAFSPTTWPSPWADHIMVVMHGAAGSWTGARIVAVQMDASTGMPLPGSDTTGANVGSVSDFATGWDDHSLTHGRPAAVEYSSDGRLFVANDNNGEIFWIAPITQ